MSKILKVNLENVEDNLIKLGEMLFGEDSNIEVNDDMEFVDSKIEEYNKLIHIGSFGEDEKLLGGIAIEQVHKQYDFETECLFGFYEICSSFGRDGAWEDFEEICNTFNKKVIHREV